MCADCDIVNALHQGSKRQDIQIFPVEQDHEPPPFITCFHGWCSWRLLEKTFIDPHEVRINLRSKMGMLGDMAACMGRSVPHVPPEERKKREKLAKKKKQVELAKSPQKDSIRERIREKSKELTNPPPPPVVPGTAVADASFYRQLPDANAATTIVSDTLRSIGGALTKRYSEHSEVDSSHIATNGFHAPVTKHIENENCVATAAESKPIRPSKIPSAGSSSPKKETPHARERLRQGPTAKVQNHLPAPTTLFAKKRHSLPQYDAKKNTANGTPSVSEALRKYTPPRRSVKAQLDSSPRSQASNGQHHLTPTTASQYSKREKCIMESASPPFSPFRTIPLEKLDIYCEKTAQDEDAQRHISPCRSNKGNQSITRRIVSAAKKM